MTNPSIQNDFSYYRRLLSRIKNNYQVSLKLNNYIYNYI